jgi:hypothetical protein
MPIIQRSVIAVPSYALEDLPAGIGDTLALDFLRAWTVLWDPQLLAGLATLPEWKRTDSTSLDLEFALLLVPELCKDKVDIPQRERLDLGKCVTMDTHYLTRPELLREIQQRLENAGCSIPSSDCVLRDDFYALGYGLLQIQILARKLRYSWNLDWLAFSEQVLQAARASVAQDEAETERWLQASFDSLSQERDRYCSQHIHLLDIVLAAKSTLGNDLEDQLRVEHDWSFLTSGELIEHLGSSNPEVLKSLVEGNQNQRISLIGGLATESIASYRSVRYLFHELAEGRNRIAAFGFRPPIVFSQFSAGISFLMPDVLSQFGFVGAIVNAWSGGSVPTKDSAKIRWQSHNEGVAIDCVLGHVFDANNAETFLHFTTDLSKQLDYHQVPTMLLAHWPGRSSEAIADLRRFMARSPALGTFETAEKYFASTNQPYSTDSFHNNQFKVPIPESYEEQRNLRDSLRISRRSAVRLSRLRSASQLWRQVAPAKIDTDLLNSIAQLERENESAPIPSMTSDSVARSMAPLKNALLNSLVESLGLSCSSDRKPNGFLVVNPCSHPQRLFLRDVNGVLEPECSSRLVAHSVSKGWSNAVVDVPPFGFVKLRAISIGDAQPREHTIVNRPSVWSRISGKRSEVADKDWTMANEYMEVQIDPKRGHLRSVYVPSKRGSRMSGMASLVEGTPVVPKKWHESDFLSAEDVQLRLVESSDVVGCIESTGRVKLTSGQFVSLTTRFTLWKGARWLEIEVMCDAKHEELQMVWRTAWANESGLMSAWQQGAKGKLPSPLQASVDLIEIDDVENKIFLATPGLSVHQRFEGRYLITLLPSLSRAEEGFRFTLGMDWPRPLETAYDTLDEPWIVPVSIAGEQKDSGAWLAQSSVPHVRMEFDTQEHVKMPVEDGETESEIDAVLWVHETRGKRASTRLSFFKNVAEAWRIDAVGREWCKLDIDGGGVRLNLHPSEQCRIALRWSRDP